jgi:hypothetical protein
MLKSFLEHFGWEISVLPCPCLVPCRGSLRFRFILLLHLYLIFHLRWLIVLIEVILPLHHPVSVTPCILVIFIGCVPLTLLLLKHHLRVHFDGQGPCLHPLTQSILDPLWRCGTHRAGEWRLRLKLLQGSLSRLSEGIHDVDALLL